MWKSFWNLKALYSFAHPRLRTLHCLAKLLNDHLPIYDTTHFFKWEFADQNFKNVLSRKVQFDNCILRFHTGDRTAILRGHRSSHAKDQPFAKQRQNIYFAVSCGPCQLYWPDPKGRNRDTLGLQSSALLTELVLLLCFRLSTSKREFSRRTPEIL